jgi:hypothetical protein
MVGHCPVLKLASYIKMLQVNGSHAMTNHGFRHERTEMTKQRRPALTAEFVRSILDYDPLTGLFTWRNRPDLPKKWNTRYAGKRAGAKGPRGYVQLQISNPNRVNYPAHQLAWVHYYGVWPADQIDHRYGIRDDNRISELRLATNSDNGCNKPMQRNNKSGFIGVHFDQQRGKWRAKINRHGRIQFDKFFDTPEQAHQARQSALAEAHGEFAIVDPLRPRYLHNRDH